MTDYLTVSQMKTLPLGARVCFPIGADAYPDFNFSDRLTGTVSLSEDEGVWVKIDQHKAELDEWDNQIQVWFWEQDESELPSQSVEVLLSPDDGSLDKFIQDYCAARNLPVDGDVFGVMFSTPDGEWTPSEAAFLILEGIRIYGLTAHE